MTHVTGDIIFRTIFSRPLTRDEAILIFHAFGRVQEILNRQGVWALLGVPKFLLFGRLRAAPHARAIRNLLDENVQARLNRPAAAEEPDGRTSSIRCSPRSTRKRATGSAAASSSTSSRWSSWRGTRRRPARLPGRSI